MSKKFVLFSNSASFELGVFSILAAMEVVVAVWLYWWLIPYTLGTNFHILASIPLAILFLFRSSESISFGEILITQDNRKGPYLWAGKHHLRLVYVGLSIGVGIAISPLVMEAYELKYNIFGNFVVIWLLVNVIYALLHVIVELVAYCLNYRTVSLVGITDDATHLRHFLMRAYFRAYDYIDERCLRGGKFLQNIDIAIIVSKLIAILFVLFLTPGYFLALTLITLTIRAVSTLKFLDKGWRNIPDNWYSLVFAQDMARPAELIPIKNARHHVSHHIDFNYCLKSKSPNRYKWLRSKIYIVLMLCAAFLYRFSIKSTFWFYWPLVLIRRINSRENISDEVLVRRHSSTLLLGKPLFFFSLTIVILPFAYHADYFSEIANQTGSTGLFAELVDILDSNILLAWPAALASILVYLLADILMPNVASSSVDELFTKRVWLLRVLINFRVFLVAMALILGAMLSADTLLSDLSPNSLSKFSDWFEGNYFFSVLRQS